MSAFAQMIAQHNAAMSDGAHGASFAAGKTNNKNAARPHTKTEKAVVEHIRANRDVDVRTISAAVGVPADELYVVMQRLRRHGFVRAVSRVGNSNLWRAA